VQVFWYTFLFFLFGGSAARGGPRPLLKYASRLLDPLLCLSIRLLLGFSVRGHVIQPSHFSSSFSSCRIQLYVQLFWNFSVLHSFYVNKPSYSLPFNEPDNIPPPPYLQILVHRFVESCLIRFLSLVHIFPAVFSFQVLLILFPLRW